MGILSKFFWLVVFLASTFAFTVLFEHGVTNYIDNAQKEWETLKKLYTSKIERKKDESDSPAR